MLSTEICSKAWDLYWQNPLDEWSLGARSQESSGHFLQLPSVWTWMRLLQKSGNMPHRPIVLISNKSYKNDHFFHICDIKFVDSVRLLAIDATKHLPCCQLQIDVWYLLYQQVVLGILRIIFCSWLISHHVVQKATTVAKCILQFLLSIYLWIITFCMITL